MELITKPQLAGIKNVCDECGKCVNEVVQLGEPFKVFESLTASICLSCLKEAIKLIESNTFTSLWEPLEISLDEYSTDNGTISLWFVINGKRHEQRIIGDRIYWHPKVRFEKEVNEICAKICSELREQGKM